MAVVSAAALLATVAPGAAQAATSDQAPDPAVAAALQRVANGSWTKSDISLLKSIPEVAAGVVDPTKPAEVTIKEAAFEANGQAVSPANGEPLTGAELAEVTPPSHLTGQPQPGEQTLPAEGEPVTIAPRITGGRWKMTHVTHTHRSLLGSTIFKYHTWAEFNYGSGKVRAWRFRDDDITNAQSIVNVGDRRIVASKTAVGTSQATSKMKRKIELCVAKYGCYATMYPYAYTTVKGSGSTSFTSGV
ncbi:hypothetical protein [Streptomyces sp. NPDC046887]|uniref:hypothetical protein n=1 Tax=Streptomyces sp. NPDC046887 TaxID=3155472 RepID=UPI0033C2D1DC